MSGAGASAGLRSPVSEPQAARPVHGALGPLGDVLSAKDGPVTRWVALPRAESPRFLAPLYARRPLAEALKDYLRNSRRTARAAGGSLAWLLSTGAPLPLGPQRSIDLDAAGTEELSAHLGEVVGEPVVPAIHLGNDKRANQKPVLYLLAPDGRLVAVAKVATGALVRQLLECEQAALGELSTAPLNGVEVARPLAVDEWRGLRLYLQSALPLRSARPSPPLSRVITGVVELCGGRSREAAIGESHFLARLRQRAAAIADPHGEALTSLVRRLDEEHGTVKARFGPVHGDLSPWNAASSAEDLLLWDLERFEADGPLGIDALHYALYLSRMRGGSPPERSVEQLFGEASGILRDCGVSAEARPATAVCYAAWIAGRYLGEDVSARVKHLAETLLQHADATAARL